MDDKTKRILEQLPVVISFYRPPIMWFVDPDVDVPFYYKDTDQIFACLYLRVSVAQRSKKLESLARYRHKSEGVGPRWNEVIRFVLEVEGL